ncbi:MAG: NAD(P)-dependent oxidoreductase [Candidatus Nanoarchaeia archaeon]|nr:NAD(P)-dependent oxidoreductase [Candidatus Nanoarchaeia archaeon]MDD5053846.1 NAD(P)-dependent oxidoreductase [Candidatus Nanoarchaeia archaeon]MDD5499599.1 NAD(P)-dependent oxidoreductase [Candidatus Nanoarchaeia archaeon]
MKKILICGIGGQLGLSLKNIFSKDNKYQIHGIDLNPDGSSNMHSCDIANKKDLSNIFKKISPDIVINAAALVNAEICEEKKDLTYSINYLGNKNILELSKKYSSDFVFISSYYVFDGTKKEYYETSTPTPINYYGIMKLLAEQDSLSYEKTLVIRPGKIFSLGYDLRNFIARTQQSLARNEKIKAINDQFNNPIHADFLSDSIKQLIEKGEKGIYNVAGKDYVSNFEFAKLFAKHFNFNESLIDSIKTDETNQIAQRPKNVELKLDKLEKAGIKAHSLEKMFEHMESIFSKNQLFKV